MLLPVHQTFVSSGAELSAVAFHPDAYSLWTEYELHLLGKQKELKICVELMSAIIFIH